MAQWRKDQGLPADAEAYVSGLKLADGVIPGESDKPFLDAFAKRALETGMSQQAVNDAVGWYFEQQQQARAAREEFDARYHDESTQLLAQEWGKEFKTNQRAIGNLGARFFPDGQFDQLLSARVTIDDKGTTVLLGDHPGILRGLVAAARNAFPASTIVDPATPDAAKAISVERAEIEKMLGDPRSEYWRGPRANELQQRYRDIIDAEELMKSRAA